MGLWLLQSIFYVTTKFALLINRAEQNIYCICAENNFPFLPPIPFQPVFEHSGFSVTATGLVHLKETNPN